MNDELDNTFGRRITMSGSNCIGWFKCDGRFLHGYGSSQDISNKKSEKIGRFEYGTLRNESEIKQYDYDIDFIAKEVEIEKYIEKKEDVISETEQFILNIPTMMKNAKIRVRKEEEA